MEQETILNTIKKMLGLEADYTPFDVEIKILINAAFFTLKQLGVGPEEGFTINDGTETFDQFLDDPVTISAVKDYIYLKVKTTWDANSIGSSLLSAYQEQIRELEHRLILDMETECFRKKSGD